MNQTQKNNLLSITQNLIENHTAELFRDNVSTWLFLLQPLKDYSDCEEELKKCQSKLRSYLLVQTPYCCYELTPDGGGIFFLTFPKGAAYQASLYELSIQLTYISEQNNINYYIGADKIQGPQGITDTFSHILECLDLLENIHAHRGVCSYENLTFLRMFGLLHQNEHSMVLNNRALQILLNYDRENQTNYVHTIRSYLASNCNISRTAEFLFIHRHTLMKRLDRIYALSGLDFNDYYARIYMSLALLFHDYFAV